MKLLLLAHERIMTPTRDEEVHGSEWCPSRLPFLYIIIENTYVLPLNYAPYSEIKGKMGFETMLQKKYTRS
jgi:hypothetical protein